MSSFSKNNLNYNDYSWTTYPTDDPKVTGKPDLTPLNRIEGYEVLYFINYFLNAYNGLEVQDGAKIEKIIRELVPATIRTQQEIEDWIVKNWNSFR